MPTERNFIFLNGTAYDLHWTLGRVMAAPDTPARRELQHVFTDFRYTSTLPEFLPSLDVDEPNLLVHTPVWFGDFGIEVDWDSIIGTNPVRISPEHRRVRNLGERRAAAGLIQVNDSNRGEEMTDDETEISTVLINEEDEARISEAASRLRAIIRRNGRLPEENLLSIPMIPTQQSDISSLGD